MTCAFMLISFSACAGGSGKSVGLMQSGKLKVGSEIGYPPFEYFTDDMTPVGLDIDIANEIAAKIGAEVEFVNTEFTMILTGLDTNQYDIAMSAITINGERKEQVDFSTPYVENWQAIVVKKGSAPIESMKGLEGLKVGLQDGTTSHEFITDMIDSGQLTNTEPSAYAQVLSAMEDLELGRVDAVLTDSTVAEGYISREPDLYEITWHQQDDAGAQAEQFGIAVKKGNSDLLKAVNDALAELEKSGRLNELRGEWLN
jgi:polar amino acid transport system substrate-binding protein